MPDVRDVSPVARDRVNVCFPMTVSYRFGGNKPDIHAYIIAQPVQRLVSVVEVEVKGQER